MFPIARFRIEDRSMEPAMAPGDYVVVNRWAYALRGPVRGDLIVVRDPENPDRFLVKRVADAAGQESYFVVGDNAVLSRDSRAFGPVPRSLIVGRVWRHVRP